MAAKGGRLLLFVWLLCLVVTGEASLVNEAVIMGSVDSSSQDLNTTNWTKSPDSPLSPFVHSILRRLHDSLEKAQPLLSSISPLSDTPHPLFGTVTNPLCQLILAASGAPNNSSLPPPPHNWHRQMFADCDSALNSVFQVVLPYFDEGAPEVSQAQRQQALNSITALKNSLSNRAPLSSLNQTMSVLVETAKTTNYTDKTILQGGVLDSIMSLSQVSSAKRELIASAILKVAPQIAVPFTAMKNQQPLEMAQSGARVDGQDPSVCYEGQSCIFWNLLRIITRWIMIMSELILLLTQYIADPNMCPNEDNELLMVGLISVADTADIILDFTGPSSNQVGDHVIGLAFNVIPILIAAFRIFPPLLNRKKTRRLLHKNDFVWVKWNYARHQAWFDSVVGENPLCEPKKYEYTDVETYYPAVVIRPENPRKIVIAYLSTLCPDKPGAIGTGGPHCFMQSCSQSSNPRTSVREILPLEVTQHDAPRSLHESAKVGDELHGDHTVNEGIVIDLESHDSRVESLVPSIGSKETVAESLATSPTLSQMFQNFKKFHPDLVTNEKDDTAAFQDFLSSQVMPLFEMGMGFQTKLQLSARSLFDVSSFCVHHKEMCEVPKDDINLNWMFELGDPVRLKADSKKYEVKESDDHTITLEEAEALVTKQQAESRRKILELTGHKMEYMYRTIDFDSQTSSDTVIDDDDFVPDVGGLSKRSGSEAKHGFLSRISDIRSWVNGKKHIQRIILLAVLVSIVGILQLTQVIPNDESNFSLCLITFFLKGVIISYAVWVLIQTRSGSCRARLYNGFARVQKSFFTMVNWSGYKTLIFPTLTIIFYVICGVLVALLGQ